MKASHKINLTKLAIFIAIPLLAFMVSCKSNNPEPLANINDLNGQWKSDDFPVPVTVTFSSVDTTAKITAVGSNSYSFRTGEVFWRGAVPTGSKTFLIAQLTKSTSGYYVFIRSKATLNNNTLEMEYSGDTDDKNQLKLNGKRATFIKQ